MKNFSTLEGETTAIIEGAESDRKQLLREQLFKAIYEGGGEEFSLVWQPQITTLSMQAVSAEVLLRWHSPLLGNIPPDQFIPIAESAGWIGEISQMVIERSLKQYAQWRAQNDFELDHFSVNLSANDLQNEDILNFIAEKLAIFEIPPQQFCVELTESELISDLPQGQKILQQLRNLGVKVALDDFGTGYSSLSYLREFDIDILKLDRSFIMDIAGNTTCQSIIQSLSAMAKVMGIDVVVEGVEDLKQREALLKCDVDLIQGFFYSRPLAAATFVDYMQSRTEHSAQTKTEVKRVVWQEELHGTQDDEIDQQHQTLFKIINQLVDAIEDGSARAQLPAILNRMQKYAEFHLLSEEILLNQVQYTWSREHHASHETIRRGIQQLIDHQKRLHPVQAYQYLRWVWVEHIQNEDKEFGAYLA